MPFDALVQDALLLQPEVRPAILDRIGLVPIANELVEPHKRRAEQNALTILRSTVGDRVAHARFTRHSCWIEHTTRNYCPQASKPTLLSRWQRLLSTVFEFTPRPDYGAALQFLSHAVRITVCQTGPVKVGIPAEVMTLATNVQNRLASTGVADTDIVVEAFYTDPIMYLVIDGKRHCLAIWDYDCFGDAVIETLATLT